MAERRRRNRKSTFHYTQVLDRDSGKQIGRLVNITTEGMMLITTLPLATGTKLPIRMVLPRMVNDVDELEFNAEVRWCKPDANPNYHAIGFKLENITREVSEIIGEMFHEFHLVG